MFTFRKSVLCISVLSICLFPSITVEAKDIFCNINGSNINVRSKPTTTANIKATLSNVSVKIIGTSGEWFKISYNGSEGWVKDDFVVIPKNSASTLKKVSSTASRGQITTSAQSTKTGTITGTNVNLRAKPTKTADVAAKLSNKKVNILSQSGDWYKVSSGKTTGWILKDFVSTSSNNSSSANKTTASKKAETSSRTESLRSKMVLYSRGFLGVHYVYGGESPSGFDCSGFTNYIYRRFGIDINRTSTAQAKQGTYVPKNKLKPGDLIFFDTNGGKNRQVNHAGMYIGNSNFIHASSSRTGAQVRISSLNESFYSKTYVTGRSFVK
jgi:N-acetylmuramoyl-L-alanine amidase